MKLNPVKWWIEWDGFLTAEGRILDPKEWHSFALGFMAGWRNKELTDSFENSKKQMHHKLEFQYYQQGWIIGEKVPHSGTIFAIGVAVGLTLGIGLLRYVF